MNSWIVSEMIGKYVEERFSTYSQLMDLTFKTKEDMSKEDKALARFSNFLAFSNNIALEVSNIFKIEVTVDKKQYEDYNRPFNIVFETHIIYDNIGVGHYGFSIEQNILDMYKEEINHG